MRGYNHGENGYTSRAHWSTALTINNDYELYRSMQRQAHEVMTGKKEFWVAVVDFMAELPPLTPEGEVWKRSTIEDIFREEMESDC